MLKSERFAFNLSLQENEALKDLAEIEGGLSRSALVRRLIRAEAKKRGLWPQDTNPMTTRAIEETSQ